MRPTLISIFILLFTFQSTFGQKLDTSTDKTPQELFDYYAYKHKTKQKAAWILLVPILKVNVSFGEYLNYLVNSHSRIHNDRYHCNYKYYNYNFKIYRWTHEFLIH